MMTIGKPDTFTQGAGVTETIKGVTGGLGAPSLGSLLSESRVLEDEEGPGKELNHRKSLRVWPQRREIHACGRVPATPRLAGCREFGFSLRAFAGVGGDDGRHRTALCSGKQH